MFISEKVVRSKMSEYLKLLYVHGYINNNDMYKEYQKALNSLVIKRIYNAPGDAKVNGNELSLCFERINAGVIRKGEYYLDEVLFHEFSHIINAFHKSLYGPNRFVINNYLYSKMSISTIRDLKQKDAELLYNQDPCFGIVLLDEFISQFIAQDLIIKKYDKLSNNLSRTLYSNDRLSPYYYREVNTFICEPPIKLHTAFSCYKEIYSVARKFIGKYGYNTNEFVKESLTKKNAKYIIDRVNNVDIAKLYTDLRYLGLILERVYLVNNLCKIKDIKDPAYNPKKINKVMKKVLSWN